MKIKVLFAGYESAPFYKKGGLGDVMGSLPKALKDLGVDARIVVPYYNEIRQKFEEKKIGELYIRFGQKEELVSVYEGYFTEERVVVYFLSNRPKLSRIRKRGRNKKIEQFAFFDLAVVHLIEWLIKNKKWKPILVHCNDWQTALIPLLLKQTKFKIPTVFTIHNLGYQGWGSKDVLNLLHLKGLETEQAQDAVKLSSVNFLAEGILFADKVTTVSPTYAKEITEKGREFIDKSIRERKEVTGRNDIKGILNGIDYSTWNPKEDRFIRSSYDLINWKERKKENKEELLKTLNLKDQPTFCFIGRIDAQKGLDIIAKAMKKLKTLGINLIVLGSGNVNVQKSLIRANGDQKFRLVFDYNEELAHKLYAGSDFILIPSHYEPCGLIQMIAQRYGTIPIASKTGGLKDSIKNRYTGFLFKKNSKRDFLKTIVKSLKVYQDKSKYYKMVEHAMKQDFRWKKSARAYKRMYIEILKSQKTEKSPEKN